MAKFPLVDNLAELAKNDLTTKIVAEIPELQGIIGAYYSKKSGENSEIYNAIAEQYLPTNQNSNLPKTRLGIALSMADKFDNICGLFLAGEKPTASKDPFALRRAALGIIRILFDQKIHLPLGIVINKSLNTFPAKLIKNLYEGKSTKNLKEIKQNIAFEIISFFIERNKAYLKENSKIRSDIINQIYDKYLKEKSSKEYDLFSLSKKAEFINQFILDSKNIKIIELYKRSSNIVVIEEKRDNKQYNNRPHLLALKTKYDRALYKKSKFVSGALKKALNNNDYQKSFEILSQLEAPITEFFDNVEINCKDKNLRENRLLILSKVRHLFNRVFDFSKIEINP
jgi:glycyl-tRNA synthetase beta chain